MASLDWTEGWARGVDDGVGSRLSPDSRAVGVGDAARGVGVR
ncbi:MAG: hypothetical protein Q7O66_00855 [Dehalococcoidia bacterium]|nr:hypothetical protein [Dehalococcoidia bacterium]